MVTCVHTYMMIIEYRNQVMFVNAITNNDIINDIKYKYIIIIIIIIINSY